MVDTEVSSEELAPFMLFTALNDHPEIALEYFSGVFSQVHRMAIVIITIITMTLSFWPNIEHLKV